MFDIRNETISDVPAREALLDSCFGPARGLKTCERLREGRLPAEGLSLTLEQVGGAGQGRLVGTVRLWNVTAGPGRPSLMLGPVAVAPDLQNLGLGAKLVREAIARARNGGATSVLLVGDAPYYGRFGFSAGLARDLWLPGPYDVARFLALEFVAGALSGARGLVQPTGLVQPKPDFAALLRAANDSLGQRAWAA